MSLRSTGPGSRDIDATPPRRQFLLEQTMHCMDYYPVSCATSVGRPGRLVFDVAPFSLNTLRSSEAVDAGPGSGSADRDDDQGEVFELLQSVSHTDRNAAAEFRTNAPHYRHTSMAVNGMLPRLPVIYE